MAQITHGQLAKLFGRLATSYSAGIDIKSAYTRESEHGSLAYRLKAKEIVARLTKGHSLTDSLKSIDGYFPDLVLSVVNAGEKGGRLEEAFKKLSDHYDSLVKFRNAFLLSIAWPLFELGFAIVLIGVVILLMGYLAGDEMANWFGMGSTEANFFFYVACVLTVLGSIAAAFFAIKKGWLGTLPMKIARRVPLVGKTIEAMALSRFAWTMSIAENAGMSAIETAQIALTSTQNYFYQRLKQPICNSLQKGSSFTKSFRAVDSFPEDFLIYVENGEESGELAESMERASLELQTRAENNLKLLGTIGFVLTILFVAAVLGATIIYMFKSMYIDRLNDLSNF